MMRTTTFKKMGPLAKLLIFLVIMGALSGGGFLGYNFFNRNVQCLEGQYLNPESQCLSCPQGCLRCENS